MTANGIINVHTGFWPLYGLSSHGALPANAQEQPREHPSVAPDGLRFGRWTTSFAKRMGVDPATIPIVASPGISVEELEQNKTTLVDELMRLHMVAKQNQKKAELAPHRYQNASNAYFVSKLVMEGGQTFEGVNIESGLENTICSERVAAGNAETALRNQPLPNDPGQANPKVKMLLLANQTLGGHAAPCPCCMEWMGQHRYFSPDTMILSLRKDEAFGKLVLKATTLKDMLPLNGPKQPSLANGPVQTLPAEYTGKARQIITQKNISEYQLRAMMQQAWQTYHYARIGQLAQKNQAAAVLVGGQVYAAPKLGWHTARFHEDPDTTAATVGIQTQNHRNAWYAAQGYALAPSPKVDAVAYYGEDENYPRITGLGKMAYPGFGGKDTLVVTIRNDRLFVSTIGDHFNTDYFPASQAASSI